MKWAFITAFAATGDLRQAERAAGCEGLGEHWLNNARVKREVAAMRERLAPHLQGVHDLAAEMGGTVATKVRVTRRPKVLDMSLTELRALARKKRVAARKKAARLKQLKAEMAK